MRVRPNFPGLPTASLHLRPRLIAGSVPGHRADRWNRQVSRVPLHDVGVTAIVETCTVSSEGVTPHSSLLRTHASIPSGSPLLRPQPRSRSLCRLPSAPAAGGTFPTLFLRIFPRMPGPMPRRSHRLLVPVSSSVSSAFPWAAEDWLPASNRETTFTRKSFSRAADIPLRSSLRVCSPPRLFLPLCIRPQGS